MAFRILLAAVFIFSGFVKAVDPWGTAIKIGEYLSVFGMGWMDGAKFALSILLSGSELMLGLMLLFGVRLRLASLLAVIFMGCMTLLTLYSAVWNPVADCGCFGDAVKLSNWATFAKNIVLFPMSIVVWRNSRRPKGFSFRDFVSLALMAVVSYGIGIACYRHLPLIDFLPYKVGTSLRAAEEAAAEGAEARMVYRNLHTGEKKVFALSDTTWYDDTTWEWVETLDGGQRGGVEASTRDFGIYYDGEDFTPHFVEPDGIVVMICAPELSDIRGRCKHDLAAAVKSAREGEARVICLTSTPGVEAIELGGETVDCYSADATMLKTMLRAKVGLVVLEDGVIVRKANCRDVLEKGRIRLK